MTRFRWILVAVAAAGLIVVALFGVRWWQNRAVEKAAQTAEDAAALANAAAVQNILSSPFEKILFLGRTSAATDLYIADMATGETARLESNASTTYSNVLSTTQTWYTVTDQTIWQHTPTGSTALGQLPHNTTGADAIGSQPSLAVDASNSYVAWVTTGDDGVESIHVFDVATQSDTPLYNGESHQHYSNLTWSPDASELGFTANTSRLITITRDGGAEVYNRVTIPFSQMNFLNWLDREHFGAVLTSTDTNPEPFEPKVVVFDRAGKIVEDHPDFEKIGVPKVIWSADSTEFLFHDPWQNLFLVYDRYDTAAGKVTVKAPGKTLPFGWFDGVKTRTPVTIAPVIDTNLQGTTTTEQFEVTADDWEKYNTTIRSILKQFDVHFDTYRFSTTDAGLELDFSIAGEQPQPEMAVVQTVAQIFAVLPNIPSVSLRATMADGSVINLSSVTPEQISAIVENFTEKTLTDLFIVNKQSPFGKRAVKPDGSGHHYVGDLVYSTFGDYNAGPVLAALQASLTNYPLQRIQSSNTAETVHDSMRFYLNETTSFIYPATWSTKTLDDQTTLFYTTETTFASAAAWSEFGLTVKRYTAPEVTLEQWLQVNRSDRTTEEVDFSLHQPVTGRHVITENEYNDEYVLLSNNTIYVIEIERTAGLTDSDRSYLQTLINSFSDHYAFQRN